MATYSELKITFKEDLIIESSLYFDMQYQSLPSETFSEVWKNIRMDSYEVSVGSPTSIIGERSAINFVNAFNQDYFDANLTVIRTGSVVVIKSPVYGQVFQNGVCIKIEPNTPANVQFTYNNVINDKTSIDSIGFLEADANACDNVKVAVLTSDIAPYILSPFILNNNTENPILFEVVRGQDFVFTIENANGVQTSTNIVVPKKLLSVNFTINQTTTPSGTNINVTNVNSQGLVLEYSLDGSQFYVSSIFTNLLEGEYNLYVKDQLGCSFRKTFIVSSTSSLSPFFYISKSNSIRYAQVVDFNDAINYQNDENTLSCQSDDEIVYKEIQRFQSSDIITTQFLSNYNDYEAIVIKEDGTKITIPITKKSMFMGNKEKRDANKNSYLVEGKTGIYFTQGNIYDYNTNAIVDTYSLNGYLPYWAKVGGYISINNTWYLIENIKFNEILNCDEMIISMPYDEIDLAIVVGAIFNYQNYEVYEFDIDFLNYINQNIQVKIVANSNIGEAIEYISETINIQIKQEGTYEIKYWNDTNTDVYYSTGIKFKLRLLIEEVKLLDKQEQELSFNDTNIELIESSIYEGNEFAFSPMSKEMAVKLKRALTHENLFVNAQGYKKSDGIDSEKMGVTNFYNVKAKLFKDGSSYNSLTTGDGEIYNGANLEVLGLLDYGGGFIKY